MPRTKAKPLPEKKAAPAKEPVWKVVVSNDPVNTMPYVVACFMRVLQVDVAEARRLMMEIHRNGKGVVWSGGRERAESLALQLQQWHLKAALESDA
jgi:ATP-dependent Clp protease adaptor protein ClpS